MTEAPNHKAEIYYYDIGDYLSREQKLDIIASFKSMENLPFTRLKPNEHGDWISQRNDKFGTWIPIEADKKFDSKSQSFFTTYSNGILTAKDAYLYNYSFNHLNENVEKMVNFYNEQRLYYQKIIAEKPNEKIENVINFDSSKISWSDLFLNDVKKNVVYSFSSDEFCDVSYRPFQKQKFIYHKKFIQRTYQQTSLFPSSKSKNLIITFSAAKSPTPLLTDSLPDYHYSGDTQCFPLYWYETIEPEQNSLFGDDTQIVRHEAVSDFILERAQGKYGNKVQKEDIFYYVYGILHSKSYRKTFSADLKKMLPRIPLISDYEKFWAFSKAGRKLANLHLNYEQIAAYPGLTIESLENKEYEVASSKNTPGGELFVAEKPKAGTSNSEYEYYEVCQMKFPKKGQKDTIIYNHYHTVKNIPEKAYEYVVNGKSAIEWIMERYAVTTDKKSGITNNPNDWSKEHEKPRYILDLLLSIINVSVQTVDIVNTLPDVEWEKE